MTTTDVDQMVAALRTAGCVFAEREAALIRSAFAEPSDREAAVRRRVEGEPLEYVVGRSAFGEVDVEIGPGCFIPRARAVALVDAAGMSGAGRDGLTALDLGCGGGAIAALLARRHPTWRVVASEVDDSALTWARRNASSFGFTVYAGSWWTALPETMRGQVDLVLAHLPYVPTDEVALLPRDFRDHEPRVAVDGGADGLDPLRAVVADARCWLRPQGAMLTQVTRDQLASAEAIAGRAGLGAAALDADPDEDEDTVVVELRPAVEPGVVR